VADAVVEGAADLEVLPVGDSDVEGVGVLEGERAGDLVADAVLVWDRDGVADAVLVVDAVGVTDEARDREVEDVGVIDLEEVTEEVRDLRGWSAMETAELAVLSIKDNSCG
jgi:hypothetical protein